MNKGLHKIFYDHGFNVVSAGFGFDRKFTERFYEIIKHYKYATSNGIMSATFYAIDLGLPFFLLGHDIQQRMHNKGDRNALMGSNDMNEYRDYLYGYMHNYTLTLFGNITTTISVEQKEFVDKVLGINDHLSRYKLSLILWREFFKYSFLHPPVISKLFSLLKRGIKKILLIFLKPFNISPSLLKAKLYILINGLNQENKIFTHMTVNEKVAKLNKDGKDPNVPLKYYAIDYKYGKITYDIFNTGPVKQITKEQKEFIERELGINDCLSPRELNILLWRYSIRCGLKKTIFLLKKITKKIHRD